MSRLGDRPTTDLIIIILAIVVAFVVSFTTIIAMLGIATGHVDDVRELVGAVGDLTGALIALLIGYIGGRGVAARNGNGKPPPSEDKP